MVEIRLLVTAYCFPTVSHAISCSLVPSFFGSHGSDEKLLRVAWISHAISDIYCPIVSLSPVEPPPGDQREEGGIMLRAGLPLESRGERRE